MSQQAIATQTRAGVFDSIALADRAICRLLTAGFSKDQVAVICPGRFKDHFLLEAAQAQAHPAAFSSTPKGTPICTL